MRVSRIGLAAMVLAAAGCATGNGGPPGSAPAATGLTAVGQGEGAIAVLAAPGYVEHGLTDPRLDWMSEWEADTGCEVEVETFETSDEAFSLFSESPELYDVISAPGDVAPRLTAAGLVQPLNVGLIESYGEIVEALKDRPWNTLNGRTYGVPHARAANLLMYRTDAVIPAPTSWSATLDTASPHAGRFSVHDSPMVIADAAVYLAASRPELAIADPYALDDAQFEAATALLAKQQPAVGEYWTDPNDQILSFTTGDSVIGAARPAVARALRDAGVPIETVTPREGTTGWSTSWMVAARARHPNCAYRFIDHLASAPVNMQAAEHAGEAPANSRSCQLADDPDHCATHHAEDEAYWRTVRLATMPQATCLDGRTGIKCRDRDAWSAAWENLRRR